MDFGRSNFFICRPKAHPLPSATHVALPLEVTDDDDDDGEPGKPRDPTSGIWWRLVDTKGQRSALGLATHT